MAKLAKETKYLIMAAIATAVSLDLTAEEFNQNGGGNGLPIESLQSRRFLIAEDCAATIRNHTVQFKKNEPIKDVGLAFRLIKQNSPIIIRDSLVFEEGQEVPESIGLALKEAGLPVEPVSKPVKAKAKPKAEPKPEAEDKD